MHSRQPSRRPGGRHRSYPTEKQQVMGDDEAPELTPLQKEYRKKKMANSAIYGNAVWDKEWDIGSLDLTEEETFKCICILPNWVYLFYLYRTSVSFVGLHVLCRTGLRALQHNLLALPLSFLQSMDLARSLRKVKSQVNDPLQGHHCFHHCQRRCKAQREPLQPHRLEQQ